MHVLHSNGTIDLVDLATNVTVTKGFPKHIVTPENKNEVRLFLGEELKVGPLYHSDVAPLRFGGYHSKSMDDFNLVFTIFGLN